MGGRLFKAKKDTRVLMVGLDSAGKTTILCMYRYYLCIIYLYPPLCMLQLFIILFFSTGKLKHGVVISTTPTVGFNVCVISVHGL